MAFMFVTTFVAAWQLMRMFRSKRAQGGHLAAARFNFNFDAVLVLLMAVLAVVSLADMLYKWYGFISGTREITSSEVVEYSAT